MEFESPLLY